MTILTTSKMLYQVLILSVILSLAIANGYYGHFVPNPYAFGYNIKDHYGEQYHQQSGAPGHAVKGNYGFTDSRGIHRHVDYVADQGGFKAEIKTNEPGTASKDSAAVKIISSAHPYFGAGHGVYGPGAGYRSGLSGAGLEEGLGGGFGGGFNGGFVYGGHGSHHEHGYHHGKW